MGPKQIDVTCPCCSTILTVDVLTRQVLRREEPRAGSAEETGGERRWENANELVQDRPKTAQDKLDKALTEEKGKEARLDDLFRKAQEKLSRKDDEDR